MVPKYYSLFAGNSELVLDDLGRLSRLVHGGHEWLGPPSTLFELTVQEPGTSSVLGARHRLETTEPRIDVSESELRLCYDRLRRGGAVVPIQVVVTITAARDVFSFGFQVKNDHDTWTVRELRAPVADASLGKSNTALIFPGGAGERIADPAGYRLMEGLYPTRLSMPWLTLNDDSHGLYLGCHDEAFNTVKLNADATREGGAIRLSISQYPFCAPGETWGSAPVVMGAYTGTWHRAADRYRNWAARWWKPTAPPEWLTDATGWQLAILKQQNGEIHWRYRDLDRLAELGTQNGLDILGLFGWTAGGHDRHYPVYEPDPAMGGEAELRAGIARAQDAGRKVILYTNGQLLDLQTAWYAENGAREAAVSERGEPFGQSWQKYVDAPMRPMACACQSSRTWSDYLLSLAKRVHELGADGIIFDQIGAPSPAFCFNAGHGHRNPAAAAGPGVLATVKRVQQEMHEIDPGFAIMVEHVTDRICQHVDLTHGCQAGFAPGGTGFPELLRYTFPEILVTQRHPTPVMSSATAQWACLYGFLHEVEYRYEPDRLYLDRGIVPCAADYEPVCSPPDVQLMRQLDPASAADSLRRTAAFARRHADLLRRGIFRDTLGFETDNPAVAAKAYVRGRRTAILLWNATRIAQRVNVRLPGAQLRRSDAPGDEETDPDSAIPPGRLRLLLFEKAENAG